MQPLIAGNWKMNGLGAQLSVIEAVATRVVAAAAGVDIAGAHTGDIGVAVLKDAGAAVVIVGHSEGRQHHGETEALVASKADWHGGGLKSTICIGEAASQRKDGAALWASNSANRRRSAHRYACPRQ